MRLPSQPSQPDFFMNTPNRIENLLQALAILAAELGPLFIHSAHGQALLQTSVGVVGALSTTIAAETAPAAPQAPAAA